MDPDGATGATEGSRSPGFLFAVGPLGGPSFVAVPYTHANEPRAHTKSTATCALWGGEMPGRFPVRDLGCLRSAGDARCGPGSCHAVQCSAVPLPVPVPEAVPTQHGGAACRLLVAMACPAAAPRHMPRACGRGAWFCRWRPESLCTATSALIRACGGGGGWGVCIHPLCRTPRPALHHGNPARNFAFIFGVLSQCRINPRTDGWSGLVVGDAGAACWKAYPYPAAQRLRVQWMYRMYGHPHARVCVARPQC